MFSRRNDLSSECFDESIVFGHISDVVLPHIGQKGDSVGRVAHLVYDTGEVLDARVDLDALSCWFRVQSHSFLEVPLICLGLLGLLVGQLRHVALLVEELAASVLLMQVAPLADLCDLVGEDCDELRDFPVWGGLTRWGLHIIHLYRGIEAEVNILIWTNPAKIDYDP